MSKPIRTSSFDETSISFGKLTEFKNTKGGGFIPIMYNGSRLRIQTPEIHLPVGITSYDSKPKVMVSLRNESNEEVQQLVRILDRIDELSLAHVKENHGKAAWSKKEMTRIIRQKEGYAKSFNLKIAPSSTRFRNEKTRENMELESLLPPEGKEMGGLAMGAVGRLIVEIAYVWAVPATGYGVTMNLKLADLTITSDDTLDFDDEVDLGEDEVEDEDFDDE